MQNSIYLIYFVRLNVETRGVARVSRRVRRSDRNRVPRGRRSLKLEFDGLSLFFLSFFFSFFSFLPLFFRLCSYSFAITHRLGTKSEEYEISQKKTDLFKLEIENDGRIQDGARRARRRKKRKAKARYK